MLPCTPVGRGLCQHISGHALINLSELTYLRGQYFQRLVLYSQSKFNDTCERCTYLLDLLDVHCISRSLHNEEMKEMLICCSRYTLSALAHWISVVYGVLIHGILLTVGPWLMVSSYSLLRDQQVTH